MGKQNVNTPKTFSELTNSTHLSSATNYNSGTVDIASDASDSEAFSTALLQNTALALTDPYLAPDGVYPIVAVPNHKTPLWKILFAKEGKDYTFSFWAHPDIHEAFMNEVMDVRAQYAIATDEEKKNWNRTMPMPPYIAQMVELQTGFEYGSTEFKKVVARDDDLRIFFVDEKMMNHYRYSDAEYHV